MGEDLEVVPAEADSVEAPAEVDSAEDREAAASAAPVFTDREVLAGPMDRFSAVGGITVPIITEGAEVVSAV